MLQWTIAFDSEHGENERTSSADTDVPEESTGSGAAWDIQAFTKLPVSYSDMNNMENWTWDQNPMELDLIDYFIDSIWKCKLGNKLKRGKRNKKTQKQAVNKPGKQLLLYKFWGFIYLFIFNNEWYRNIWYIWSEQRRVMYSYWWGIILV